jgi:hypothetical protein
MIQGVWLKQNITSYTRYDKPNRLMEKMGKLEKPKWYGEWGTVSAEKISDTYDGAFSLYCQIFVQDFLKKSNSFVDSLATMYTIGLKVHVNNTVNDAILFAISFTNTFVSILFWLIIKKDLVSFDNQRHSKYNRNFHTQEFHYHTKMIRIGKKNHNANSS